MAHCPRLRSTIGQHSGKPAALAVQHEFVCIDEGHATLLHIDERDQSKNWIVPIGQPAARDMQLIGGNKILIGHHHGYTEFDLALGACAKDLQRSKA